MIISTAWASSLVSDPLHKRLRSITWARALLNGRVSRAHMHVGEFVSYISCIDGCPCL